RYARPIAPYLVDALASLAGELGKRCRERCRRGPDADAIAGDAVPVEEVERHRDAPAACLARQILQRIGKRLGNAGRGRRGPCRAFAIENAHREIEYD